MAPVTVHLDIKEFEARLATLKRPHAPLVRALNRSIGSGQTLVTRLISQDTGLKVSDVRRYVTVRKATQTNLSATIRVSAARVPLILFGAKGREPSRGKPPGVRANLRGGAGTYPRAFITRVGSGGHRGVFERKGQARLPIGELRGPSLWQSFQKHAAAAAQRTQEQLGKNVQHEIAYALTR